jgi:hypothetical protein
MPVARKDSRCHSSRKLSKKASCLNPWR